MTGDDFRKEILQLMKVRLSEAFDRNFQQKGFFGKRWRPRARDYKRGSLLMVTGKLRRSIRSKVIGNGVQFTSDVDYATIHNEGLEGNLHVPAHSRRSSKGNTYMVRSHSRHVKMPERRFVGDGEGTRKIIQECIEDTSAQFRTELEELLKGKK